MRVKGLINCLPTGAVGAIAAVDEVGVFGALRLFGVFCVFSAAMGAMLLTTPPAAASSKSTSASHVSHASQSGRRQMTAGRGLMAGDRRLMSRMNDSAPAAETTRWDLRTAPVAFLASWYTFDASYRIGSRWATGPSMIRYASTSRGGMFTPSYNGYAIGWSANHYFKSVLSSGWYASLHAYHDSYDSYPHGGTTWEQTRGTKVNTAAGYRWKGERFDLLLGYGVERRAHEVKELGENAPTTGTPWTSTSSFNDSGWMSFFELKVGIEI